MITHRGRESVSAEELRLRLEDDGALEDWARRATEESTLHELVVNFYFKSHPELGCEFLHKSFREYLHAESIVDALEASVEAHTGPLPLPGVIEKQDYPEGSLHHRASRTLGRLLAPYWLTPDVRGHVFWLMEQRAPGATRRWVAIRDLLADVFNWWTRRSHLRMRLERRRGQRKWIDPPILELLEDAAPLDDPHLRWSSSIPRLDAMLGSALIQLAAKAHALLLDHPGTVGRHHQTWTGDKLRFRPFDPHVDLAARLTLPDPPHGFGLTGAYLGPVDMSEIRMVATQLGGCDLGAADLSRSTLHRVDLAGADLQATNLTGAQLSGVDASQAVLHGADLTGSRIMDTKLTQALLDGVSLRGAQLHNVDFTQAVVSNADLGEARLYRADFVQADVRNVDLRGSQFFRPDLTQARLIGIDITQAEITDAWLDHTDID